MSERDHRKRGTSSAGAERWTRRRVLASGAAVTPAVLAACTPGQQGGANPGAATAAPITYRDFTSWSEGKRPDMLRHMKRLIEEKFPGVTYELEFLAGGSIIEAVTAQFAAGTPADFQFLSSAANTLPFMNRGDLLDVGPYATRDKLKWDDYAPIGDTFKADKGRILGVPFTGFGSALFYNKTLWDRERLPGSPTNWTWTNLQDWGKQVVRDDNRDGTPDRFMLQNYGERNTLALWGPFLYGNGGSIVSADGKKSTIAEPAAVETFEFLADLALKQNVATKAEHYATLGVRNYAELFSSQRGVLQVTDSGSFASTNSTAEAAGFTWDVGAFPKSPRTGKTAVIVNVAPRCLAAKVKEPDRAWNILKFMAGPEVQPLLGVYQVSMPALKAALNDTNGWLKAPPASTRAYNDHVLKDGVPMPAWEGASQYFAKIQELLKPGFDGVMAMRSACQAAAEAGDTVLRQQGRA